MTNFESSISILQKTLFFSSPEYDRPRRGTGETLTCTGDHSYDRPRRDSDLFSNLCSSPLTVVPPPQFANPPSMFKNPPSTFKNPPSSTFKAVLNPDASVANRVDVGSKIFSQPPSDPMQCGVSCSLDFSCDHSLNRSHFSQSLKRTPRGVQADSSVHGYQTLCASHTLNSSSLSLHTHSNPNPMSNLITHNSNEMSNRIHNPNMGLTINTNPLHHQTLSPLTLATQSRQLL